VLLLGSPRVVFARGSTLPWRNSTIFHSRFKDKGNVATLYAMQRIIKESEAGILPADPTQVMTVLARELDFFWKRITRVA
jgi:hypothetical protein